MTANVRNWVAGTIAAIALTSSSACTVHATTATAEAPPPASPPPPPAAPPPPAPPPPAAPAPAHPAYLHALSDLRNARANLERRGGDFTMKWDEQASVAAIDRAIAAIKHAALDDGKPLEDHPAIDVQEARNGRLHRALAALQAARGDVNQEEDNAFAQGLRGRALHEIDEAIALAQQGIAEADAHKSVGPAPAPIVAVSPKQAHPAYLHALSDLRNARANLEHRGGDVALKWDERDAVGAIDRAIGAIKQAALDDGKTLQDHPAIDAHEPRAGRLHKALAALETARSDVSQEEDNGFANGLRGRGLHEIDEAIRFTQAGIGEAEHQAAPVAEAPRPQAHPAYLRALSDLRNARANLERKGGDHQMRWDEHVAIGAIDRAIGAIKQASVDDGKPLDEHPPVDAHDPRAGRLHKALAALQAARADVAQEEDNAFANGLRARGLHEIDDAIRATQEGIAEADKTI
jgi:hypothetical protein